MRRLFEFGIFQSTERSVFYPRKRRSLSGSIGRFKDARFRLERDIDGEAVLLRSQRTR